MSKNDIENHWLKDGHDNGSVWCNEGLSALLDDLCKLNEEKSMIREAVRMSHYTHEDQVQEYTLRKKLLGMLGELTVPARHYQAELSENTYIKIYDTRALSYVLLFSAEYMQVLDYVEERLTSYLLKV